MKYIYNCCFYASIKIMKNKYWGKRKLLSGSVYSLLSYYYAVVMYSLVLMHFNCFRFMRPSTVHRLHESHVQDCLFLGDDSSANADAMNCMALRHGNGGVG